MVRQNYLFTADTVFKCSMVLYSHSHRHSVFGGHGFSYAMRHALCDFSFALVGGAMPAIGSLEDVEDRELGRMRSQMRRGGLLNVAV